MGDAYKREVIAPGDRASKYAKEVCGRSFGNSPAVHVVSLNPSKLRGAVGWLWRQALLLEMAEHTVGDDGRVQDWKLIETGENDSAGGKLQFGALLGKKMSYYGMGWEPIVMCAEDLVRHGALPVLMVNEVQAKRITYENFHLFQAAMDGYGDALMETGLVNTTGEVAIIRHCITSFCDLNSSNQLLMMWGGSCIGLARKEQYIDPSTLRPGMSLVGCWENGHRCNASTSITTVGLHKFGSDIKALGADPMACAYFREAARPSLCYTKTVSRINGWNPDGSFGGKIAQLHGVAHITGSGIFGKLGDILPKGVGAVLSSMPKPPKILRLAQEYSQDHPNKDERLSDYKMYSSFNGGLGMLLVVDHADTDAVIDELAKDGKRASVVGEIVESPESEVLIDSQFMQKRGRQLSSLHPE